MKSFIGNLLFIAFLLIILTRFLSVISGTAFPIDIVTANSMSPALMEGDLVAWTPTNIEDVEVGDVIVFKSWLRWPGEKLLVHRVVDIKHVIGKTALVTKGDANKHTDQAGPHIPEPYVTEKNFVGKTLSIGKQPLKIPFVGIIGIWVNEGINLLSQPSASKGTMTYVGVFTPLTISVILLIISLFILPEKAKTNKEKIQFYIFGTQGLDVKKAFAFFLSIFIVLLTMMHFFAYDSTSSSLGVGEFPDKSAFELGSVPPGKTGFPRRLPLINPGVMPVKGIIFGNKELSPFVDRGTFELEPRMVEEMDITATVPNGTMNGTYAGDIMVYSSPLWFLFPDELIKSFLSMHGEGTVLLLDILSACVLTIITIFLILTAAFIENKYRVLEINLSWHYTSKLYLKKGIIQRLSSFKKKTKKVFMERFGWIGGINLAKMDGKSITLALLVLIPLLLLLNSEILAMFIASLTIGGVAYFMSCKTRSKIVLVSVLTIMLTIAYTIIKTNYLILSINRTIIESLALGLGSIGIYLLVLVFLLIPLSLLSWYFTHHIRNLKERKDPLLVLEGRCDL